MIQQKLLKFNSDLEFFGVASEPLKSQGYFQNYGDLSIITDKMYEQIKNFYIPDIRHPIIVSNIKTKIQNALL